MSIIKHVTLQKIVAHDFRYDLRIYVHVLHNVQAPGGQKYKIKKLGQSECYVP